MPLKNHRLTAAFLCLLNCVCFAAIQPAELRCEYRTNPLGIDVLSPRLGWILESAEQNQLQTAYQIQVATSAELLRQEKPDLWDSGIVKSEQVNQIPYGGEALRTSQQVFWRVRAWDQDDQPSQWSTIHNWTMGVLNESDFVGRWIAAPTDLSAPTFILRKPFHVKPALKRAVAHVSGLGQYEMTLNGKKVGDDLLTPGWTMYTKTCLYDTYDITPSLRPGDNAIGLLLGTGMYHVTGGRYTKFRGSFGPLKAIAQIRLEYEDGSVQTIGTDDTWRIAAGPITFSCVYGGEDWDARLEIPGWDSPGFDDSSWRAAIVTEGPGGALTGLSAAAPPIRVIETRSPVKKTEIRPNVAVYDLGQNASMMIRIKAHGPAGSSVKITPAELVRANGSINRGSAGGGDAYWKYTLRGDDSESWQTRFFYHGCRYLQVETAGDAVLDSIEGLVVHSTADPIGEFSCSNELFNRIRTLVRWAQRSNMASVLSDCPHRERLGWMEQVHLNGPSLRYEFDLASFFTKSINDMADCQQPDGLIPSIAPEYTVFKGGFRDSPEWGSAFILAAWQQYEWTGDRRLIERHYDGMKRYLMYLDSKSTMGIVSHGLGDWYDLGPKRPGPVQLTPKDLTATATFYSDALAMQKMAQLLDKPDEAREFGRLAQQIRRQFNREKLDEQTRTYGTNSQTSNAMPLALGMVDEADKPSVLAALVKDIRDRNNGLTAGDVGYRYLLRALADNGRSDVIFDMNNQSDRPGYGYQLRRGATSLTEGWGTEGSQNHFMLGHIIEWFYHDVAGIQPDPEGPGFRKIIIKPTPVGDLTSARASLRGIRGNIVSEWTKTDGRLELRVVIPAGSTAKVHLPGQDGQAGIREIGSGEHHFVVGG